MNIPPEILEEFEAAHQVTEANLRHSIIQSKYIKGELMYRNAPKGEREELIEALAGQFKVGKSTLRQSLQFYEYVQENWEGDFDTFIVGSEHSSSWTRIRNNLLYDSKPETKSDPREKGESLAKNHIKKEGVPYTKEYAAGYTGAITDHE